MSRVISTDCVFRSDVRGSGDHETACCDLVRAISGAESFRVAKPVCQACQGGSVDGILEGNPVLPSLVFQACREEMTAIQSDHGVADPALAAKRMNQLQSRSNQAERQLVTDCLNAVRRPGSWACDVIVPLNDQTTLLEDSQLVASLRSILNQQAVRVTLHLIGPGDTLTRLAPLATPRQLVCHPFDGSSPTLGRMAHSVATSLRSEYVAWHDPRSIAEPKRLCDAIETLWTSGGELFLAPIKINEREIPLPTKPLEFGHASETTSSQAHSNQAELLCQTTMVCRRSTMVDSGGFCDSNAALFEFVRRITLQRDLIRGENVATSYSINPATLSLSYPSANALRQESPIGFPVQKIDADVVLPFHNHFDFVEASLQAAIDQQDAETVVHVINDRSTEDASQLRRRWANHRQVRWYENRTNIGQFMSLNNVSDFCDTGLIVVQDADDISLPNRVSVGGNLLHHCDADFFGGAVDLFGDGQLIRPVHQQTDQLERIDRAERRLSFYPPAINVPYFLENPTAIFRVDMFRQMGGYADFGSRELNRSSLDSEFLIRCFCAGARFAITRQVVTRYRVHSESATQNRVTGWGTDVRAESSRIVHEHTRVFRQGDFDPRAFGSLGRFRGETEPIL